MELYANRKSNRRAPVVPDLLRLKSAVGSAPALVEGGAAAVQWVKPHSLSPSKPSIVLCSKTLVPPARGRGIHVTSNPTGRDSNQQAAKPLTSNRSSSSCNGSSQAGAGRLPG